jgi:hypothetical protein
LIRCTATGCVVPLPGVDWHFMQPSPLTSFPFQPRWSCPPAFPSHANSGPRPSATRELPLLDKKARSSSRPPGATYIHHYPPVLPQPTRPLSPVYLFAHSTPPAARRRALLGHFSLLDITLSTGIPSPGALLAWYQGSPPRSHLTSRAGGVEPYRDGLEQLVATWQMSTGEEEWTHHETIPKTCAIRLLLLRATTGGAFPP